MKRKKVSTKLEGVLKSARRLAESASAEAIVLLAEEALDFKAVKKLLRGKQLVVASDRDEIIECVREDGIDVVPVLHEPQTRGNYVSLVLLEAIADEILQSGDTIIAVYSTFERDTCDTISVIELAEQLARPDFA